MPEQYHNEKQLIIGEAAVHLAINNADITVDSLIRELTDMAAAEDDPARCMQIKGAKCLLRSFAPLPSNRDELRWISGAGRGSAH